MSLRAEIRGPRGILCTRGEKAHTSKRQTIVACDDCLVKSEVYDARCGNPPEGLAYKIEKRPISIFVRANA